MCPITSSHCGQASRASKLLGMVSLGARKASQGFSGRRRCSGWPGRMVPIRPAACFSVALAKRGDQCAVHVRLSGAMAISASSVLVIAGRARISSAVSRDADASSTSVFRHVSASPLASLPVTTTCSVMGGAPAGMVCVVEVVTCVRWGTAHACAIRSASRRHRLKGGCMGCSRRAIYMYT